MGIYRFRAVAGIVVEDLVHGKIGVRDPVSQQIRAALVLLVVGVEDADRARGLFVLVVVGDAGEGCDPLSLGRTPKSVVLTSILSGAFRSPSSFRPWYDGVCSV